MHKLFVLHSDSYDKERDFRMLVGKLGKRLSKHMGEGKGLDEAQGEAALLHPVVRAKLGLLRECAGTLGGQEARQSLEPGFPKNVDILSQEAAFIQTQASTYHESVS